MDHVCRPGFAAFVHAAELASNASSDIERRSAGFLVHANLGSRRFVLLIVAGTRFAGPLVLRLVGWRQTFEEFAVGAGASMLGSFLARLHLWVFDKLYLRFGRKESILKKSQ